MSKVIKRLNAYGMGGTFDQPGYEYDPVNDTFKDLETGKVFSKEYVKPNSASTTPQPTVKLESNKAQTIDVSTYTEPVEVTPSQGKDGMEKTTITLSNIPEASDIESNKAQTIDVSQYTEPVEITPTSGKDGMAKATVTLSNIPSSNSLTFYAWGTGSEPDGWVLFETPHVGDTFYPCGYNTDSIRTSSEAIKTILSIGEDNGDPYIEIPYDDPEEPPLRLFRFSDGDITFPIALVP